MSFEIDLVRHGETVAAGVLLGRTDAALSERGERQMRGHASRCRWDRVVAAPLGRAQASARLLAGPDQAIETVAGWAELDFGDWDGRAIASLDPADYQRYVEDPRHHAPPGERPSPRRSNASRPHSRTSPIASRPRGRPS